MIYVRIAPCICCYLGQYLIFPLQKEGHYIQLKKKVLELVAMKCCNSEVSKYDWKIQRWQEMYQKMWLCAWIVGWPKTHKNQMLRQYGFSHLLLHPLHKKLFRYIQRLCSMKTIFPARLQSKGLLTSAFKKCLGCSFDNSKIILKWKENQPKRFWSKSHWL